MRKRNFKGRCVKRSVSKSQEVCRTYDAIQNAYLDVLEADDDIVDQTRMFTSTVVHSA